MSVLLIVGPKYTLAASHAVHIMSMPTTATRQTDRQTPDRYIMLSGRRARK